ncbi:ester cyclase [Massilia sp. TN1-12]|uniref:ester cyclase n=1 Tax=Massilia paldalensis TaxID=3377675 RepID=UPI00384D13E2
MHTSSILRSASLGAGLLLALSVHGAASASTSTAAPGADADLVQARTVIVDQSLPKAQAQAAMLAARRYATFWNTGEDRFAQAALAPRFTDRTLPPGRAQGPQGPLAASTFVRTAIPDLRADLQQMIVTGDRVTAHYRFHGHFTGQWAGTQGKGQDIDFIATDIYRIEGGSIVDNWHIEDNLTLMRQLGLVAR